MSFCVDKTENSLCLTKLGCRDNWLLPLSAVSRQDNTGTSGEPNCVPRGQWNSCLVPCVKLPDNLTGQPLGPWRLSPQAYSLSLLRLLIKNDFIMKLPQIATLFLVVLEALVKNLRDNRLGFSSLLKTSLSPRLLLIFKEIKSNWHKSLSGWLCLWKPHARRDRALSLSSGLRNRIDLHGLRTFKSAGGIRLPGFPGRAARRGCCCSFCPRLHQNNDFQLF